MEELVLYYAPENTAHVSLLKGVLAQMGIKIKNLTPGRCEKKIGFLAGLEGFEEGADKSPSFQMTEELLVFCGFTDSRLDELLSRMRKAGVPKIGLKAIVTETNAHWTVRELYQQLEEEHKQMNQGVFVSP